MRGRRLEADKPVVLVCDLVKSVEYALSDVVHINLPGRRVKVIQSYIEHLTVTRFLEHRCRQFPDEALVSPRFS
jgi:hypothetical protein